MTLREFLRECARGRMTRDRAMWLMEQNPDLWDAWCEWVWSWYRAVCLMVDAEAEAVVAEAEQILEEPTR